MHRALASEGLQAYTKKHEGFLDNRKPFAFTIHSRDRMNGTVGNYQINFPRDIIGDWIATVQVTPFASNATNKVLELVMRGGGIQHECTEPTDGVASILSMVPGISSTTGTIVVSGGFRSTLEIVWLNSTTAPASAALETTFPEHSIHMFFTPI
jgi:hypothetical protein